MFCGGLAQQAWSVGAACGLPRRQSLGSWAGHTLADSPTPGSGLAVVTGPCERFTISYRQRWRRAMGDVSQHLAKSATSLVCWGWGARWDVRCCHHGRPADSEGRSWLSLQGMCTNLVLAGSGVWVSRVCRAGVTEAASCWGWNEALDWDRSDAAPRRACQRGRRPARPHCKTSGASAVWQGVDRNCA